ncbi:MAG: GT-D fold domain-containing glycosyltransferase [Gelidibacter sp.]
MGVKRFNIFIKKRVKQVFEDFVFKYFVNDFKNILINQNVNHIAIQTTYDTLNEIETCIKLNRRGAYLRFGDGDVYLLNKKKDSFQTPNDSLSKEMLESFQINEANVFKSLAIHSEKFGYEKGMFVGNHKNSNSLSINLLESTFLFFIGQKIYSPVALHFIATQEPIRANLFLKLLKLKTKLFIGSINLSSKNIKKLFGNSVHIKTPSENAYNEIDRIYLESKIEIAKFDDFAVVVVAMGCSGRPLMKRLLNDSFNVFLFDFGSLIDGLDGVNNRTWLKVNNIDYVALTKGLD